MLLSLLFFGAFLLKINYIKQIPEINRIIKSCCMCIFFIFITLRIYKFKLYHTIDEVMIFIFCSMILFSSLVVNRSHDFMDVLFPIRFFINFVGFSSFLKLYPLSENFVIKLLNLVLIFPVIHFLYSFYYSYRFIADDFYANKGFNAYLANSVIWQGMTHNPNAFGYIMMVGIICACAILFNYIAQEKKRIVLVISYSFVLFLLFFSLLMSASRASMIGVFAYIVLTLIIMLIFKKSILVINWKRTALVLFMCGLFVYALLNLHLVQHSIEKWKVCGSNYRIDQWSVFIKDKIQNFPSLSFFFGDGYNGYTNLFNPEWKQHYHNLYIEIWAKYGIINLFAFIIFCVYFLIRNFYCRDFWFIYCIPIAFFVHTSFESTLIFYGMSFETFCFMMLLLIPLHYKKNFVDYRNGIDIDTIKAV